MLIAPFLAIALAFLLAGSMGFLPENGSLTSSQPSSSPVPSTTPLPTAQAMATTSSGIGVSILFAVAAIAIGIVAAILLFSEKNLKKENNR
jgi:hypothetical protein